MSDKIQMNVDVLIDVKIDKQRADTFSIEIEMKSLLYQCIKNDHMVIKHFILNRQPWSVGLVK